MSSQVEAIRQLREQRASDSIAGGLVEDWAEALATLGIVNATIGLIAKETGLPTGEVLHDLADKAKRDHPDDEWMTCIEVGIERWGDRYSAMVAEALG